MGKEKSASGQFGIQATGGGATLLWSAVATGLIAMLVKATIGLRVRKDQEFDGMDRSENGENAYLMEP